MRKLQLDLESLHVTSFATTPDRAPARGTVHGLEQLLEDSATAASACSWTNGVFACKSCGPCCA
jgi:hypothetical protein